MTTAQAFDDALDAALLRSHMLPTAVSRFAALDIVDTLDSTNSELLRRRTPAQGIAALFAERQTGGRGRQGRVWASPPGSNLYLSMSRCFNGDLARLGGLSLAVGIAAAEALHSLGADAVRVKWPNDLVIDDGDGLRKLGGVLIEGGMQDGQPRAVIGLGLNVRMPADATSTIDQPWTDLHALLGPALPSRNLIAARVLTSLAVALDDFDHAGLASFLPRFAALDALHGAEVNASTGDVVHAGTAAGIAEDGALRLRTEAGDMLLHAGEVRVRKRTASQA